MFNQFQAILNYFFSIGRLYQSYDHIDKILIRLPKHEDLRYHLHLYESRQLYSLEELKGTLTVQEAQNKKNKSFSLNAQN